MEEFLMEELLTECEHQTSPDDWFEYSSASEITDVLAWMSDLDEHSTSTQLDEKIARIEAIRLELLEQESEDIPQKKSYQIDANLEQNFRRLADEWRSETIMYSLVLQKTAHPAYLRIIGMGEKAIPLILRELQERGGYWFVALNAISGEDPVQPGSNYQQAVQAWLNWGKAEGYLDDPSRT